MAWGYVNGQYGWIDEAGVSNPITGETAPSAPSGGGTSGGLAQPVSNVGTNGSNARYYIGPGSGLQQLSDGTYTDGVYHYDANGLALDRPDSYVPGLPPANESESYDVWSGQVTGGGGGGGGGTSLYGGGGGDSFYNQLKSMLQAQSAGDLSNTRAAIQKALIGFGLVPEGFNDKLGALDDVTKNLIAKNTESGISTYARMLEQKKDIMRQLVGRLSNQGLRRSGAKGAKLRRGQLDFDRLFQDSLSELLGQTGNMYSSYATNEQNRQMQMLQALQNSQSNMWSGAGSTYQQPQQSSGGGFTPAWQGTWAQGIDTGGYVPNSGVITDYGNQNQTYNIGGGRIAF